MCDPANVGTDSISGSLIKNVCDPRNFFREQLLVPITSAFPYVSLMTGIDFSPSAIFSKFSESMYRKYVPFLCSGDVN